ncbi:hypothetical protein FF2_024930 [Malus domestica]
MVFPQGIFDRNGGYDKGTHCLFLFLLCAEALSAYIRKSEEAGLISGVRVVKNMVPISHLFFADDSVVFCKSDVTEAGHVVKILEAYGKESSQIINLERSSIFSGKGCPKKEKKHIVTRMNIQAKEGFGKYLGIQADFGHSKKAVFESVRRGIESQIDGWAEQFLSPTGKEVLIKSVAMPMPNHAMACFKLPVSTCKELERIIAQFWCRGQEKDNGCHWVAWEKLTMRKKDGRLGFRDLIGFNLAMLAKVSLRVLHTPDSMLGVVLRDKYFPNSSFLEANNRPRSS